MQIYKKEVDHRNDVLMEGWKDGRMEYWNIGRMEKWKNERMES